MEKILKINSRIANLIKSSFKDYICIARLEINQKFILSWLIKSLKQENHTKKSRLKFN